MLEFSRLSFRRLILLTFFVLLLALVLSLVVYVRALSVKLVYHHDRQVPWFIAKETCMSKGYRLPNIFEMWHLFFFEDTIVLSDRTDYWVDHQIQSRSFGLNTRSGILSFDVAEDKDHFLCVDVSK